MQEKDLKLRLKRSNGRWFQHLSNKVYFIDVASGCSLDSSSGAQTGNFFASNVIEFVTSCSCAQQRSFVLRPQHGGRAPLSPTANRGAAVSCSGWPLIKSGHVTKDAAWLTDRQIQANWQQSGGKGMKRGVGGFRTFPSLLPVCRLCVQVVFRGSAVCGGAFSPACREMHNTEERL